MKIRIDRTRMAMRGRFYAYDVTVPMSEVPHAGEIGYYVVRDGERCVSFCDATLPASHWSRPKGYDRYDDRNTHERRMKPIALALARRVFPELAEVAELPTLWAELPDLEARHATLYMEYGHVRNPDKVEETSKGAGRRGPEWGALGIIS